METILRNIALGVSLAAPLGPSGVAVISSGLRRGFLAAFLTGLGVTLADGTYLLLVHFGLSSFMTRSVVRVVFLLLGALVLLYLGAQSIREAGRGVDLRVETEPPTGNPIVVGYLINVSNPIAIVWWVGVFGALLGTSGEGSRLVALLVSSTILLGILLWHSTVSLLSHWGSRFLTANILQVISVIAGVALILFGLRFAYESVSSLGG